MADEVYVLGADVGALERSLLDAVSSFEAMDGAALRAAGAVGAVGRESSAMAGGQAKVASSARSARQEIDKSAASSTKLTSAARMLGGQYVELAGRSRHASAALGTLGTVGMASSAVITSVAATYAGIATKINDLVVSAIKYEKEYRGVISVTEDESAALREADGAYKALDAAAAQASVTIGAAFAGDVAQAVLVTAKLVLATDDLLGKFEQLSGITSGELVGSLLIGQSGYASLTGALDVLDGLTQRYDDDVQQLADGMTALGEKSAEAAAKIMTVADAEAAVRAAMERHAQVGLEGIELIDRQAEAAAKASRAEIRALREKLEGVEEYGEDWESIMLQIDRAEEDLATKTEEYEIRRTEVREREATERQRIARDESEAEIRMISERLRVMDQIGALNEAATESFAGMEEAARKSNETLNGSVTTSEDLAKTMEDSANATARSSEAFAALKMSGDAVSRVMGEIIGVVSQLGETYLAAALESFGVEKAAAKASIIIEAAALAIKLASSMAAAGPVGVAAAIGIAGALAAVQMAMLEKAEPPSFHFGGTVGSKGAGEVVTVQQVGERVLTREQQADMARPTELRASFVVGARVFDAMVLRSARQGIMREQTKRYGRGQSRFSRGVSVG